ncbi:MAG: transcription antitermination factor NusB [Patescibacteria group bacterium]
MANRHLSRSVAIQSLFEWDFNGRPEGVIDRIVTRNVKEFAPGLEDKTFVNNLVHEVITEQRKLDHIIEKAAPEWPIEKIAIIDRNILRVGLWELLFADRQEVPSRVAINEAIEIAKTYGGENSGKFVNGVLGTVYKEMGEPGKDDIPAKKRRVKDIPYEDMPVEKLGGAVVYARDAEGQIYLAFVHDVFGHWTLPKGHVEKDEDEEKATIRKIKEEIGVDIKIIERLAENEYVASNPEVGKIRKRVSYYLAESSFQPLQLEKEKGGLDGAQWFPLAAVLGLNMYDDIVPIVTRALDRIANTS